MESQSSPSRISMREIAKQLGVSHATVSMALRNDERISVLTREKVRRHAREAGYKPDPMLTALARYRQGKSGVVMKREVAWINAWPFPEQLRGSREFDGYWQGAKAEAEKFGYKLEEFQISRACSPLRLHQILSARGIGGILLPPHAEQPDWEGFPWSDYSVVRIGKSLQTPVTPVAGSDQMANAMLAFTSMRDRGYRKVGFFTGRFDPLPKGHFFGVGWLASQNMIPQEERVPAFQFMRYPVEDRLEFFLRWLDRHQPDAMLSDVPEVHEMLRHARIRVPHDLGLAVTNVLDGGVDSGIDQHSEEIGRRGVFMLNSFMDGMMDDSKVGCQLLVDGHWVNGASLPPRNGLNGDSRSGVPT